LVVRKSRSGCVAVLLLAAVLSGCGSASPTPLPPPRAVQLELTEFTITPGAVSAEVGERISFRVSNTGVLEHNVSIQDPSGEEIALLSVLPKQHGTLQIEPSIPGLWKIICTLPGHEMAGMTATLTVAP